MKSITIKSTKRSDGKYRVTYVYAGAPNAFGGFYPSKTFNKLHTAEQIGAHKLFSGDRFVNQSGEPDTAFFTAEQLGRLHENPEE